MNIVLTIYKWIIFELSFMCPNRFDDLDFTYFNIGILPFYFSIEKYLGRISLIFQIYRGSTGGTIFDYEKILKESEVNNE